MKWTRKRGYLAALAGLVVVVVAGIVGYQLWRRGRPYRPPRVRFEGDSCDLRQTVVVPTLDTPIVDGKNNVVWCGSIQIAWNRLAEDVLHAAPAIDGADAVVSRLNQAGLSEQDLPSDSHFAAAGWVKDGIVETVRKEMKERFQLEVEFEDMPDDTVLLAYSYLQTHVKFTIPFFENRKSFLFKDSTGRETPVTSFGIRAEDDYAYFKLRHQVEVLYAYRDPKRWTNVPDEFIVDLCRNSKPNQIVLACVPLKETLAATLKNVEQKIRDFPPNAFGRHVGPNDVLLVPNMNWEIDHRFAELEGSDKPFLNPGFEGYYFDTVRQTIRFKLDRSGAELRSQVKQYVAPKPTYLLFGRPFLLFIKKRTAEHPFFVMWVDNAELLSKPKGAGS